MILGRQPPPPSSIVLLIDDFQLGHRAPVLGRIHAGVDGLLEVRLGGRLVLGDDLLHARVEAGVADLVLAARQIQEIDPRAGRPRGMRRSG